jgi:AcrR family transcriptional regulator
MLDGTRTFAEISVEELITEAGVARSTFYAHFEDKGALLVALAEHVSTAIEEGATRWYHLERDATRDDLRAALFDLVESYRHHQWALAAIVEGAGYDARVKQGYHEVISTRILEMERSFRSQQEEGGFCADINVTTIAPWIGWMTERGLYQLIGNHADDEAVAAHVEGLTDIMWRICYDGSR